MSNETWQLITAGFTLIGIVCFFYFVYYLARFGFFHLVNLVYKKYIAPQEKNNE